MGRSELASALYGAVLYSFHSLSNGSDKLEIPYCRLKAACKDGYIEKLTGEDLRKLSPHLANSVRDEMREWVLP